MLSQNITVFITVICVQCLQCTCSLIWQAELTFIANSWYQQFEFLISANNCWYQQIYLDIKNWRTIVDIKNCVSWYQELKYWYQEFDLLISLIYVICWYHEIEFLISRIRILDINIWIFDIKNSNCWYQELVINVNSACHTAGPAAATSDHRRAALCGAFTSRQRRLSGWLTVRMTKYRRTWSACIVSPIIPPFPLNFYYSFISTHMFNKATCSRLSVSR